MQIKIRIQISLLEIPEIEGFESFQGFDEIECVVPLAVQNELSQKQQIVRVVPVDYACLSLQG